MKRFFVVLLCGISLQAAAVEEGGTPAWAHAFGSGALACMVQSMQGGADVLRDVLAQSPVGQYLAQFEDMADAGGDGADANHDDASAVAAELARLQGENAALKAQIAAVQAAAGGPPTS